MIHEAEQKLKHLARIAEIGAQLNALAHSDAPQVAIAEADILLIEALQLLGSPEIASAYVVTCEQLRARCPITSED